MYFILRFISFVAGSFAGILALMTLLGQELLLGFEITHGKTVFFYIGVFGSVLAVSRGMIPDENLVFDPSTAMKEVIVDTHFEPEQWKGKMHTEEVCSVWP
jgi:autophagy-related protein 9